MNTEAPGNEYAEALTLHHSVKLGRILPSDGSRPEVGGAPAPGSIVTEEEHQLIKDSLGVVAPRGAELIEFFYDELFKAAPAVVDLFPNDMAPQRDRLLKAIIGVVQGLDRPDVLVPALQQLGRDHRKFGAQPAHYDLVGKTLLAGLAKFAGDAWNADFEAAWTKAYTIAAKVMIDAAEAENSAPPYWYGTIVSHELRTPDIAVLRVRPDQPYPYQPGQHATLESERLPKTWRLYSIAGAPRADNLLEFHVRRVTDDGLSKVLVQDVKEGDQLRIGPPLGTTVVDAESTRDVLAIAGGTGLAPMKAVVEALTEAGDQRRVHLFYGARHSEDLYDLPALRELASRNANLTLVPVVSREPEYDGERGRVADVLGQHGTWEDHDVYIAGSPGMMRATLLSLSALNVPVGRLRYDAIEV